MAEVLRDAGYFTAMTGKWHLGQQNGTPPWERGFHAHRSTRRPAKSISRKETDRPGSRQVLYLNGRKMPKDSPELGTGTGTRPTCAPTGG